MFKRLWRRWRARTWRCRCGKRVFDKTALGSHPLAPTIPDSNCAWHKSVRAQVLSGRITRSEDAR
jgi:hypothetical protein